MAFLQFSYIRYGLLVVSRHAICLISIFFLLSGAGIDQVEVLSDSEGSVSPDRLSDGAVDPALDNLITSDYLDLEVGSMVEIVIRGKPR